MNKNVAINKMSYEQAVKRLEEVVQLLEQEGLGLDTITQLYEEGMQLVKICNTLLDETELKIYTVTQDIQGSLSVKSLAIPHKSEVDD